MRMLIAIVVGALAGVWAVGPGGALLGGLVGWLVARTLQQQDQIDALTKRLDAGASVAADRSSTETTPIAPRIIEPKPEYGIEMEPESSEPDTIPAPLPALPSAPPMRAPRPPIPVTEPSPVIRAIKAWLFGGNTIVKAGIGILFVGLAFLARYASEHTHLPIEWRLAAIGATAAVLLTIGWRLRLRRPDYAQVLQGGAVAVLYLTIFAAYRHYDVLAALPAFVLMVVVALLAAALAVLQDARALAVIGALGGFATPLLVSTGSNNIVGLLAYYFVLDVGIAVVAWFRTWRSLNLIGFIATFGVSAAWGITSYQPSAFASCEAFLIAFFLLFIVILLLPARRVGASETIMGVPSDRWVNNGLLLGLPTIAFALQYGLVHDSAFGVAISALVLGGFYVGLAAWMKKRPALGITFEGSLAIATVLLSLVIPFALDARSTAGAWSIEGAGLVWVGCRQQRGWPRAFGYGLLLLAAGAMAFGLDRFGPPTTIVNAYLLNGLMAATAGIAAAFFVHRQVGPHPRKTGAAAAGEALMEPLLIGFATLWLIATAQIEFGAFVPFRFDESASIVALSGVALVYALLAARLQWSTIAMPAIAQMPLLFLFAAAEALELASPAAHGGWWAWPIAFVVHAAVLRLAAPRWPGPPAHAVHALGVVTLGLLGALLGRTLTAGWGEPGSAWQWLGWLVAPALLLMLLPRPALARRWPISACPEAYRISACAALAAGLWFWTVIANIACDGTAAPLPHVPLLNPLDLGIAFALLATALWLREVGSGVRVRLGLQVLGGIAGFVWLNAMLVRAFHHYAGVPYRVDAWMNSLAVQTGITLLWTVLALIAMWLAARKAARWHWFAGATLLGAAVLKLLMIDLSGSESVTRIVSFIGVGVLMLLIGYVAPMPNREAPHATT